MPDIAFAVNQASRFVVNPTKSHWEAGKRILRYVISTKTLGLVYQAGTSTNIRLIAYSDSDWAGELDKR